MNRCPIGRLSPDVELIVDSGGADRDGAPEVRGAAPVRAELHRLRASHPDAAMTDAVINGAPGWVVGVGDVVIGVVCVQWRGGAVSRLWIVTNPDKLQHWNRH